MTSPSGSLPSHYFWPEIWGNLVKTSRREERTEREQMILFFLILNSVCQKSRFLSWILIYWNMFCTTKVSSERKKVNPPYHATYFTSFILRYFKRVITPLVFSGPLHSKKKIRRTLILAFEANNALPHQTTLSPFLVQWPVSICQKSLNTKIFLNSKPRLAQNKVSLEMKGHPKETLLKYHVINKVK